MRYTKNYPTFQISPSQLWHLKNTKTTEDPAQLSKKTGGSEGFRTVSALQILTVFVLCGPALLHGVVNVEG